MPTKIEDFGEKFWGARKDLWHQRGLLFSDLEGANPSEKAKYAIKSNVIPKLDYKKMKEDGYSVNVLYFYKMVIDSLPTKPHYRGNHVYSNGQMNFEYENEDEDINNFINLLTNVKKTLLENVKTDEDIDSFYDKLNPVLFDDNHIVKDGYKTLVRESNLLSVSQAGLRRVKGAVLEKQFLMTAEEIERARYEIYLYDNEHVTFEKDAYNGDKEYLAIRSIGYSRFFHRVGIPSNEWKDNTYFVTYGNFLIRGINYSTREEALTKIDEFIKEDLAKDAEESKKTSNRKKNFTPSGVENIERKANFDWLQDDASPEKYLNEFKFRGGEFGNWENQKERQINLNHAYNSFSDIALALGISLESVSGNGKLGIAFGSRGHSRAAAHYEPDSDVINLTRMNGAGALGHEWGHFFDHLIGDGRFASESYKMPEMKELMQIMKYKDEPIKEDDFNEQKNKDIQRYLKGLNQYIDIYFPGKDSYTVEQLQKRTNLINALKEDATKNPDSYLYFSFGTREEPKALVDLSNYKNELTGRVIPKDNRKDIANYCQWYGNASSRTFDSTLTKRVSTEYYKGSIYFDDNYSHSGHDYWKSDVELFARAFQCYLKDKLTEANITNDYLCGYADGYIMMDSKGEYHRAYPYGEERKLINDAFDKLIAKVKEDNVFVQSKNWEHLKNVVVLENEAQMEEFKNQNEYATINEPLIEEKDNDFNLSLPEWYLNEYGERIKEFKEITGNLNYENTIKNYIHEALINADVDIKFNDIKVALYGSKIFGDNHDYNHGDIDILVEFNETDNFDVSEDTLFNILNDVPDDEKLYLGNLVADFNPILASKSGDIEEHLLNAKKYWQEKTNEVDDVFDVNYVKENTEMLNPDKPNEHIRNLFDLINEEPVKQEEPKIIPYNIENFEINYELSDGTYFHFHTNEEGYYYSIYNSEGTEIDGGLMEYDMPFENIESLQSVMERLSDFTGIAELKNSNLKEVSQDYIDDLEAKVLSNNKYMKPNGTSQIDLNVETAINNLGFIYDNEISKTLYYESLNDVAFKDKFITPKLLKNDTIEYFYDQETNLLLFKTWNDENVIIPCTKENIDKIGVQLFYKVSNNPNYSETEHKKENQKELNNKELNLVAPDKKIEYLSRIASAYLSQARYGEVAIELNYSHNDLSDLGNLKNLFNHLYDYSIAHTNAYNDKETLAFYNKAINELSSDKAQLALNNSIAPMSEKDMSLDNKLSTNVEELTNMYRMWSNSETRYEDVIEPSSLYFKFDKLMQDSSTEEWASENRIKLIAFFKDMRNKALSFVDFNKLTPEELKIIGQSDIIKNKITNELTFFDNKRELYKTLATFNSTKYTFNNSLLIHSQCRVKGYNAELTNTFDSWKQNQNTSVSAGSKAMMIIQPKENVEYYEYDSNNVAKRLPNTHDKTELSKYENMVKDKKGYKRVNKEFVLLPRIFSIDQTKLSQSEKYTLLMNKNTSATEDVISKDINRLSKISKLLPITLSELDGKTSETKVWSNLVEIGNHLFKPEKPEGVNKVDLEIKSNLFANIICEGLGINSIDASDNNLDISGLSNSSLLSQLHSIEPAVKLVGSMLMSDNIADYQAYQLKNFTLNPQKNKYVGKVK